MPQVTIMMSASTQLKQLMSVRVQVQAPRGHKQCPWSALSSPSHCRHVNTTSLSVETKHRNHKHQHWILLSKECGHKTNMKVKKLQWRLFPLL